MGDLNGDNAVDLADGILGIRVLSGIPGGLRNRYPESCVDVDANNQVGLADVIYILQTISNTRP